MTRHDERPVVHPTVPLRLRSGRPGSLRLALCLVALGSILLGLLQLAVGITSPSDLWAITSPSDLWAIAIFTAIFWVWAAAGILAWWRRPNNATGALIVFGGMAVFVAGLQNLTALTLAPASVVFGSCLLAIAVHLLHAFPSGKLHGRVSVVAVVVGYAISTAVPVLLYALRSAGQTGWFAVTLGVQRSLGFSVMVVTVVVLVRRLRRAEPSHRKILLPLFVYGCVAVLAMPLASLLLPEFGASPQVIGVLQMLFSAGLPIAFLVGVLLGGFTRTGELEALSVWLGTSGAGRQSVAEALASTLGDSSLQVVYWVAERSTYVDKIGAVIEDRVVDARRTWLDVRVESRLVGAIEYDNRMIADPSSVRRVGQVLAIAIDRERLTAELLASNDALLQSRVRLVEAADRERIRIAQSLHDGLQVQLVLLALEAQQLGNAAGVSATTSRAATQLRQRIDDAAADLRRLVHNVLPAALLERGLSAATEDLVDRLEIAATLVADVDDDALASTTAYTAYVIVAEGLTNAVRHSQASSVHVRLSQIDNRLHISVTDNGIGGARADSGTGTGLNSLADRVDAVGGTFLLTSPRGLGTELKVELPCV